MRLRAADIAEDRRCKRNGVVCRRGIVETVRIRRTDGGGGRGHRSVLCCATRFDDVTRNGMIVSRHFRDGESVVDLAKSLSEYESGAHMRRCVTLHVRQRKSDRPVAPVRRTEDGKQCLVLIDRQ